jgi:DnaJ-domain-containing protein 1
MTGVPTTGRVRGPSVFIDSFGLFVIFQIGGFYYRQYLRISSRVGNSSGTPNPPQVSKKTPKLDPYGVLGVPASATMEEISKAYRNKAKENHPDKVANMAPEIQALADQKMKEINEAYNSLKEKVDS